MKKYIAVLLAVLMLVNAGALCVFAEETTTTTTAAQDDPTSTTTTTTEDTTTTEGESTTTTSTTVAGFAAEVLSATMLSTGMMEINYTSADGSAPNALTVAGKTVALDSAGDGKALVAQEKLPFGTRTATLEFPKGSVPFYYNRAGQVNTVMQIEVSGNSVYAILKDKDFNLPVANATIAITVDDRDYTPQKTNSDGRATFAGVLPSDKAVTVKCVFTAQTIDNVDYSGQTGFKNVSAGTSASEDSTTSTTLPTAPPQTNSTHPTVYDTLTTSSSADGVLTDVIVDTNILSLLGMENISAFTGKAKVLIPQTQYDSLSASRGGAIYATVLTTDAEVTAAMIAKAIADHKNFNNKDAATAVTFPFAFALQVVGNGVDQEVTSDFSETAYTVTIPVPESMADAGSLAVAMVGNNSLYNLQPVTVKGGTATFTVSDLDDYVLIGFKPTAAVANDGGGNALVVILYVVGILLILGAAVVLLWPILAEKFFKKPEETAEETEEDDVQAYGEPETETPAEQEEEQPEAPTIIPPPLDTFPTIPVEKKEPVADVSLGDFGEGIPTKKSGIDVEL